MKTNGLSGLGVFAGFALAFTIGSTGTNMLQSRGVDIYDFLVADWNTKTAIVEQVAPLVLSDLQATVAADSQTTVASIAQTARSALAQAAQAAPSMQPPRDPFVR